MNNKKIKTKYMNLKFNKIPMKFKNTMKQLKTYKMN